MTRKITEKIKSYFLPKEISDTIHRNNRKITNRFYIFSILFGLIPPVISLIIYKHIDREEAIYYGGYIIAGVIGVILCHTRSGKYTPTAFVLIAFLIMFNLFIFFKSKIEADIVYEAILVFLGFAMAAVMLLDLNPIVFAPSLIAAELIIIVFFMLNIISSAKDFDEATIPNLLIVNVISIYLAFWKRRVLLKKYKTEASIIEEKAKSEELLLNILPKNIMEQLRDEGKTEPVSYENASVLFCEILGLRDNPQLSSPDSVVSELNAICSMLDDITEKNHCLRIKTCSETYMAVCGLPEEDPLHAQNIVRCAKEFMDAINKRNETEPVKIKIRIGISSGCAVAGIVGIKKFIYDVFGDAVNMASRMKELSEPMETKVSPETYCLTKDIFSFEKKNPLDVKGKGQMDTFDLVQ